MKDRSSERHDQILRWAQQVDENYDPDYSNVFHPEDLEGPEELEILDKGCWVVYHQGVQVRGKGLAKLQSLYKGEFETVMDGLEPTDFWLGR